MIMIILADSRASLYAGVHADAGVIIFQYHNHRKFITVALYYLHDEDGHDRILLVLANSRAKGRPVFCVRVDARTDAKPFSLSPSLPLSLSPSLDARTATMSTQVQAQQQAGGRQICMLLPTWMPLMDRLYIYISIYL